MNERDILQGLPDKPLLRIGEVAHFFAVSPKTIYEWYNSGILEGIKYKGVTKISRASVINFIKKNEERTGRRKMI